MSLRRSRLSRWLDQRFNPGLDLKTAHLPAMVIFGAAGASSCATLLLYQLTAINFIGLQSLMLNLGKTFLPGSQGSLPVQGYLGTDAGIFIAYFLIFTVWWVLGLQIPFLTLDRLPHFVALVYIVHIILAWQLF